MEISIHIHEDYWGMRNLHALEALSEVSASLQAASEAGVRNSAPDGAGWTDVHLIKEPSIGYANAGLRLTAAAAALEPPLPRVRKFTATASAGFDRDVRDPWGSYDHDSHCYGFDESCFIKLEEDGELVKQIWLECTTKEAGRIAALRSAMLALDALVPSAVADYWNDMSGAIQDPGFLDRYFQELS